MLGAFVILVALCTSVAAKQVLSAPFVISAHQDASNNAGKSVARSRARRGGCDVSKKPLLYPVLTIQEAIRSTRKAIKKHGLATQRRPNCKRLKSCTGNVTNDALIACLIRFSWFRRLTSQLFKPLHSLVGEDSIKFVRELTFWGGQSGLHTQMHLLFYVQSFPRC